MKKPVAEAVATICAYLDEAEIEYELASPEAVVLVLPGEHRLKTTVSLVVGDYSVSINAFVVRNPDENHQELYAWLLRRNQRMYAVSYAIDHLGDVYLVGKVSLRSITSRELDRILGTILENSDGAFDFLLELGFSSAITREWQWRLSRGESTQNLAAFRHLAPDHDGVDG